MMWVLILAWLALLGVGAILAQQFLGFNLDEAAGLFLALPPPQQAIFGFCAVLVLFLIAASVWQAAGSAQRTSTVKTLQRNLGNLEQAVLQIDGEQKNLDAAGEHLTKSDPEQALATLQTRVADTEGRAALQKSRNDSVDLQVRLEGLRQRQHALRKQLGEVADQRRLIDPVFGELKERQAQLEQSLSEIETDDSRNSLAGRVKEVSNKVGLIQLRLKALENSWESLNRFKEELGTSQTQLVRLNAPEDGLAAMIDQLHATHGELSRLLEELEVHNSEKVTARAEALSKSGAETEQRIARLDDCFAILNAVRRNFGELEERRAHLERALKEVETDAAGRSLADRQNELNEFAAQARVRVRVLQDTSTALAGFGQDIDKAQAALIPLQSPVDGIEALIGNLQGRRDRLTRTLEEIELNGDEKLGARVEALYRSKIETERRIAQITEQFAKLDSIRNEIDGLFGKLGGTIAGLG